MNDIVMCSSNKCPVRKKCFRNRDTSLSLQPSFNFEYTCNEDSGFCDYIKDDIKAK